jgi:hypothetical protein
LMSAPTAGYYAIELAKSIQPLEDATHIDV